MWLRFFTGPYRIRPKGRKSSAHLIYDKLELKNVRLANGNVKFWYKLEGLPKPPINEDWPWHWSKLWGRAEVGGLPMQPGRMSRPRPRTEVVPRRV
jgi:hypothetical protein